jgi:adenine-specific DNA-methyltransferase
LNTSDEAETGGWFRTYWQADGMDHLDEPAAWFEQLNDWERSTTRQSRRAQGSIWTPEPLARWMAEWVGANAPHRLLDPGAGAGNLLAFFPEAQLSAAECDPQLRAVLLARYPGIELFDSFWAISDEQRFDAIIANPPYINHAQITDKAAIHDRLALALPKTSNLAVLFYVRCWQLLADGGRMIFLMPTEFMQTRSGISFKRFLLEHGAASVIVDLDDGGLFGEVVSTASLVLAEKAEPVTSLVFAKHSGRPPYRPWPEFIALGRRLPLDEIVPERRWRPGPRSTAQRYPTQPLAALAEIESGAITGNNQFFIRSWPEISALGLTDQARYCLIRPQQLPTRWFHNAAQIEALKSTEQRRWLIAIGEQPGAAAQTLLDQGVEAGINTRPTQRSRQPWWEQPGSGPSDFLISNFRRSDYSLLALTGQAVIERAQYVAIPNIVRLRSEHQALAPVLFAWLIAEVGQTALRTQERHAGNGLHTLRSGALKSVLIPLLQTADPSWQEELLTALEQLRQVVLAGQTIDQAKAALDQAARWPGLS